MVVPKPATTDSSTRPAMPVGRASVRWFAGEFLVVVAGVLAALAMQSWYQARRDAKAASVYVAQLQSDLEASVQMLRTAVVEDSLRAAANAWLLTALHDRANPSADSSTSWLRFRLGYYSDPRPVLGTVNTLIETGDIRLIGNARLRSQIVAYASLMATDAEELSRHVTRLISASDAERLQWEKLGFDPFKLTGTTSRTEVAGTLSDEGATLVQEAYSRAWPILKGDPEFRAAVSVRQIAFASRVFYLRRMMASTDELLRLVLMRDR